MQGRIEQTRQSNSGKSIGVLIGGKWYSCKDFSIGQLQGQDITFETSRQSFPDGGGIDWLNDYTVVGSIPNTADQVMNQAMAGQPPPMGQPVSQGGPNAPPVPPMGSPQPPQSAPQAPQTPARDRDSSIIAQALTKACTAPGDSVQVVWERYSTFYRYATGEGSPADFDDSINF